MPTFWQKQTDLGLFSFKLLKPTTISSVERDRLKRRMCHSARYQIVMFELPLWLFLLLPSMIQSMFDKRTNLLYLKRAADTKGHISDESAPFRNLLFHENGQTYPQPTQKRKENSTCKYLGRRRWDRMVHCHCHLALITDGRSHFVKFSEI